MGYYRKGKTAKNAKAFFARKTFGLYSLKKAAGALCHAKMGYYMECSR